ncbi:MAG: methylated-DNA--[protein]-cysteine S-methyltransferase [Promethearchaeota archaeon]
MPKWFTTFNTPFNDMTIVWTDFQPKPLVDHIFLTTLQNPSEARAKRNCPQARQGTSPFIDTLAMALQSFLQGDKVDFDLTSLNWALCSDTQQRILRAEAGIPRGWISTYKRIAQHVGIRNGARVVGNALARNPFPIIIPCHRAVKSDGSIGGYQGGLAMKRKLLEKEGIQFSKSGKVVMLTVFY